MKSLCKALFFTLFTLFTASCGNRHLQRSPGPAAPSERTERRFSAAESERVRMPEVNPLPGNGLLVLPLASLKKEFCYPYDGKLISPFGPRGSSFHAGIDIKAVPNGTVRAALPGVVRLSKLYGNYGNIVVIHHDCGIETVYAHHSKNLVKVNDRVEAGQPIGLAGRTGNATTEHLHFEVRAAGEPLDPTRMVNPETRQLRSDTLYVRMLSGKIFAYNSMKEGNLMAEQIRKSPATASTPAKAPTSASSAPATDEIQYYRVQSGDTLFSISRRYETTVDTLCRLNDISITSILKVNQQLRVK